MRARVAFGLGLGVLVVAGWFVVAEVAASGTLLYPDPRLMGIFLAALAVVVISGWQLDL